MNIVIPIPEDALVLDVILFLDEIRRSLPWGRPCVRIRLDPRPRELSGSEAVTRMAAW